ncbi:MAG: class I SAM-dependent methyltransferase [Candidatus Dormibacteria bacterium]
MSSEYDQMYYENYCGDQPYARSEPWLSFFGNFATHVVADLEPATALDLGCAMGLLVEALRDRGVEAFGVDISEYAINNAREDIRPFVRQASGTDPLDRRYDVIICIEVLEHLSPNDAARTVENICAHTDDVIFSSTPDDFREATHLNVRRPDYWAGLFAQYGMFRDVDYQVDYVAPWAVRFRRTADPVSRVVMRYERLVDRLGRGNRELRDVVIVNQETTVKAVADATAAVADATAARADATAALAEAEHDRAELAKTEAQLSEALQDLQAMRETLAWRTAERGRHLLGRLRLR